MTTIQSSDPGLLYQLNGGQKSLSPLSTELYTNDSANLLAKSHLRMKKLSSIYKTVDRTRKQNIKNLNRVRELLSTFHTQLLASISR